MFTLGLKDGILEYCCMENFRQKHTRKHARQAIDGFLNAPVNRGRGVMTNGNASKRPRVAQNFRSSGVDNRRVIGDFKAAEGYRSSDRTGAGRIDSGRFKQQPRQKSDTIEQQFTSRRPSKDGGRKRGGRNAKKQGRSWKKFALRGSLATLVIIVALGGFFMTKGYLKLNNIFKGGGAAAALDTNVDPTKLKGEGDGRINILLLGRGGVGHAGADLTDTIVVASIDPVNKKAALLSLPRDTWVDSKYGDSKINAVFANAKSSALRKKMNLEQAEKTGVAATEQEVEDILGIQMHYYVMVDFKGFEKAVNTVGGVTINVPEALRDPSMAWENKGNPVLAKQGTQTMDGKKALMYVRSRHGSARGDFDRAERQRLFILALKSEVFSSGTYGNPLKISRLMDDFGDNAKTDFSMNDLLRLYSITKGIGNSNINSIGLADPPNDYLRTGNYGGLSVVMPKAGIFKYDDIQKYVRGQLPDGYILKEKAPIIVLNGTSSEGLAGEEAEELKSYSYNIKKTDNAPTKNYLKTVIVDLDGKNKYTKNYLEKRYDVKVTRTLPQGITLQENERKGFVIIIGSNETSNR